MKRKLFILISLLFVSLIGFSQTTLRGIGDDNTLRTWGTDYTLTNAVAQEFIVSAAKHYPSRQSLNLSFTKVSGSHTDIAVVFYGKVFEDDSWVLITSGALGTTLVTSLDLTINTPLPTRYRYFRWTVTGTGTAVTTITEQSLKLWIE